MFIQFRILLFFVLINSKPGIWIHHSRILVALIMQCASTFFPLVADRSSFPVRGGGVEWPIFDSEKRRIWVKITNKMQTQCESQSPCDWRAGSLAHHNVTQWLSSSAKRHENILFKYLNSIRHQMSACKYSGVEVVAGTPNQR